MTPEEQKIHDLISIDPEVWFSNFAIIKDKRGKNIKPIPNILQKRMFEHYRQCQIKQAPCKMVILKPRQKGASTCAQALTYHHMRKFENLSGSLMGDISERQSFRDLSAIRRERRLSVGRNRNKLSRQWKSRGCDQAKHGKRVRKGNRGK